MTLAMTRSTVALPALDELCVNTLRFLAVDMVQKGQLRPSGASLGLSGHGLCTLGSPAQIQPEGSPLA
jgi:transketolase